MSSLPKAPRPPARRSLISLAVAKLCMDAESEVRKLLLPAEMMAPSDSSYSDEPEPGPAESEYMGFDLFR